MPVVLFPFLLKPGSASNSMMMTTIMLAAMLFPLAIITCGAFHPSSLLRLDHHQLTTIAKGVRHIYDTAESWPQTSSNGNQGGDEKKNACSSGQEWLEMMMRDKD